MLRKTFIQDLVLMMELRPCHPIWQHSVLSDPVYLSFKRQASIVSSECSSTLTLICWECAADWTRSWQHTPALNFNLRFRLKYVFVARPLFCSFFPSSSLFSSPLSF
jgi:hypothetical protein